MSKLLIEKKQNNMKQVIYFLGAMNIPQVLIALLLRAQRCNYMFYKDTF